MATQDSTVTPPVVEWCGKGSDKRVRCLAAVNLDTRNGRRDGVAEGAIKRRMKQTDQEAQTLDRDRWPRKNSIEAGTGAT